MPVPGPSEYPWIVAHIQIHMCIYIYTYTYTRCVWMSAMIFDILEITVQIPVPDLGSCYPGRGPRGLGLAGLNHHLRDVIKDAYRRVHVPKYRVFRVSLLRIVMVVRSRYVVFGHSDPLGTTRGWSAGSWSRTQLCTFS